MLHIKVIVSGVFKLTIYDFLETAPFVGVIEHEKFAL